MLTGHLSCGAATAWSKLYTGLRVSAAHKRTSVQLFSQAPALGAGFGWQLRRAGLFAMQPALYTGFGRGGWWEGTGTGWGWFYCQRQWREKASIPPSVGTRQGQARGGFSPAPTSPPFS